MLFRLKYIMQRSDGLSQSSKLKGKLHINNSLGGALLNFKVQEGKLHKLNNSRVPYNLALI